MKHATEIHQILSKGSLYYLVDYCDTEDRVWQWETTLLPGVKVAQAHSINLWLS